MVVSFPGKVSSSLDFRVHCEKAVMGKGQRVETLEVIVVSINALHSILALEGVLQVL